MMGELLKRQYNSNPEFRGTLKKAALEVENGVVAARDHTHRLANPCMDNASAMHAN